MAALEQRIAEWSQVPVSNQEQLQVLRYGIGQQYRDHWDYFEEATLKARTILIFAPQTTWASLRPMCTCTSGVRGRTWCFCSLLRSSQC